MTFTIENNPPAACSEIQTLPGSGQWQFRHGAWWMDAPRLDVPAMAEKMNTLGARLATMSGSALEDGETEVIYHYALGADLLNIRVLAQDGVLPSIAARVPAADWIEREIMDLFDITFTGHPNPTRLIRPPQLAAGLFRKPGGAAGKTRPQE